MIRLTIAGASVVMIGAFATIARSENVQIAVQVVEPVVYGDKVQIQISYTNEGDKAVYISSGAENFVINGVDIGKGNKSKADLTAYGKIIESRMRARRARGSNFPRVLRPNKSADVMIALNLYYDMTVPDDYRVVVKRGYTLVEGGKPRHVEMDPVTLDISYRPTVDPKLGAVKQP
jgi:hypothetical protein